MKKLITIGMMALSLAACSSNLNAPDGKTYQPYGVLTQDQASQKVCYEVNKKDVILGVIFFETAIAPVYIFGFDVKEPKRLKNTDGSC